MKTILDRRWFNFAQSAPVASATDTDSNQKLVAEYLSWKGSYAPAAVKSYRVWVKRFQEFANKAPESVTISDFTRFAEHVKSLHAPKGVEFALNIVHNYLRFFAEQGRLKMPMYLIRVPKAVAQSYRAVEPAEYQQILKHLTRGTPGPIRLRDTTLIMLLHDTGMRIGELLSLRMRDVEPGNSSAVVVSEKSKILRRVFWSDETNGFMRRHVATRGIEGAQFDDMLFVPAPKYGSEALNARSVQRMLRRVATSAGIAGRVVPHSFRHSYIHRLASVGTPDAVIAQMIGHRTPLTISHYTKLSRPEMQSVANQRFVEIAA